MTDPRVSVIIPAYNHARFLGETLASVARQTLPDWECIVVDDGSTDATRDLVAEWVRTDQRFRYVHQDNRGLSAARNRGRELARAPLLQLLDADDLLAAEKLETQAGILDADAEIDVAFSNYRPFDSDTGELGEPFWPDMLSDDPLEDFLFRWERGLCIPIHTALFRSALWADRPIFDERLRAKEDWVMWIELALRGARFDFLDRDLAFYRMHAQNMFRALPQMSVALAHAALLVLPRIPDALRGRFVDETMRHVTVTLERGLSSADQGGAAVAGPSPQGRPSPR